jgi:hypothetical protein
MAEPPYIFRRQLGCYTSVMRVSRAALVNWELRYPCHDPGQTWLCIISGIGFLQIPQPHYSLNGIPILIRYLKGGNTIRLRCTVNCVSCDTCGIGADLSYAPSPCQPGPRNTDQYSVLPSSRLSCRLHLFPSGISATKPSYYILFPSLH